MTSGLRLILATSLRNSSSVSFPIIFIFSFFPSNFISFTDEIFLTSSVICCHHAAPQPDHHHSSMLYIRCIQEDYVMQLLQHRSDIYNDVLQMRVPVWDAEIQRDKTSNPLAENIFCSCFSKVATVVTAVVCNGYS